MALLQTMTYRFVLAPPRTESTPAARSPGNWPTDHLGVPTCDPRTILVRCRRRVESRMDERTPAELALAGGSNLSHLAVAEGFEPSVDLRPQTLSRRSP